MSPGATDKFLVVLRKRIPAALPEFLLRQRWFGGKARSIRDARVVDVIPLIAGKAFIVFAAVRYVDGPKETYVLPLAKVSGFAGGAPVNPGTALRLAEDEMGPECVLQDAFQDDECLHAIMSAIGEGRRMPGLHGEMRTGRSSAFGGLYGPVENRLAPVPLRAEQSNTSIRFGDRLILKCFRKLQEGVNPDLEIEQFLTEQAHFQYVPAVAGSLEYVTRKGRIMTVGILQAFVANQGNFWDEALRSVGDFYARVRELSPAAGDAPPAKNRSLLGLVEQVVSPEARNLAGSFLAVAGLLGERTAQLHEALASAPSSDDAFAPEPFTPAFRAKLRASLSALTQRALLLLRQKQAVIPERWREAAERVAGAEDMLVHRAESALRQTSSAIRTRIHGDYHLGQVLKVGSDLVIIDFEGEPARTLRERRLKKSPLQDVAGMLRSFHYAAHVPLMAGIFEPASRETEALEMWAARWWEWMAGRFLRTYLEASGSSRHVVGNREEFAALLEFHLLEKAIYELDYEMNNRPDWVGIPLRGILSILENEA